ncbi:MAG: polyprenyl diphosphate synthase [Pseudomonadota bacterium]
MVSTRRGTGAGPRHVAIIMDGNGRWAARRGMARSIGHRRGIDRVRDVIKAAPPLGIEVLTLFAFSTENWRRPNYEIDVLMGLFKRYLVREADELDAGDIRLVFIGDRTRLPLDIQRLMDQVEERTRHNARMTLQVALNYGSRAEIVRAAQRLAVEVAAGRLSPDEIDEAALSQHMWTSLVPDPDLVIRTSGEMRVSNFLLWQAAYAEFAFVEECWPEFTPDNFAQVVGSFAHRERRYGAATARG